MQHPVIQFYLDQRKTPFNLNFDELINMPLDMVCHSYFYIPWLFPVTLNTSGYISKWNRKVPIFTPEEAAFFSQQPEIQTRFLQAFDFVIKYFLIERQGNTLTPMPELEERPYWLREIGHETKKISRFICSLHDCGQPELAENLRQLAIQLGQEKGFLLPETLIIWQGLLDKG